MSRPEEYGSDLGPVGNAVCVLAAAGLVAAGIWYGIGWPATQASPEELIARERAAAALVLGRQATNEFRFEQQFLVGSPYFKVVEADGGRGILGYFTSGTGLRFIGQGCLRGTPWDTRPPATSKVEPAKIQPTGSASFTVLPGDGAPTTDVISFTVSENGVLKPDNSRTTAILEERRCDTKGVPIARSDFHWYDRGVDVTTTSHVVPE